MNWVWTYPDSQEGLEGWYIPNGAWAGFDGVSWQSGPETGDGHARFSYAGSEWSSSKKPVAAAPYNVRDLGFVTTEKLYLILRCDVELANGHSSGTIRFAVEGSPADYYNRIAACMINGEDVTNAKERLARLCLGTRIVAKEESNVAL